MSLRHRGWLAGLAAGALLVAACATPAPAAPAAASKDAKPVAAASGGNTAGDVEAGKALFASKGCIACHVAKGVPGATGTIGPNLNGIGDPSSRPKLADGANNTPEHIREWIKDPQKLKPGTMMPNLQLSDAEADNLTAFLLTLK
ncbi:MAG: cytochrome c family protein [Chloroflexota bacterium]